MLLGGRVAKEAGITSARLVREFEACPIWVALGEIPGMDEDVSSAVYSYNREGIRLELEPRSDISCAYIRVGGLKSSWVAGRV